MLALAKQSIWESTELGGTVHHIAVGISVLVMKYTGGNL